MTVTYADLVRYRRPAAYPHQDTVRIPRITASAAVPAPVEVVRPAVAPAAPVTFRLNRLVAPLVACLAGRRAVAGRRGHVIRSHRAPGLLAGLLTRIGGPP